MVAAAALMIIGFWSHYLELQKFVHEGHKFCDYSAVSGVQHQVLYLHHGLLKGHFRKKGRTTHHSGLKFWINKKSAILEEQCYLNFFFEQSDSEG